MKKFIFYCLKRKAQYNITSDEKYYAPKHCPGCGTKDCPIVEVKYGA